MLYLPLMILCNRYSIGAVMTKSNRGGKRAGAGRPVTGVNDTKVVRIDAALVPVVNAIKEHYSNNGTLDYIDTFRNIVTGNQIATTYPQERAEANLELMEGLHSRTLVKQKKLKKSLEQANLEIEKLKSVTPIQVVSEPAKTVPSEDKGISVTPIQKGNKSLSIQDVIINLTGLDKTNAQRPITKISQAAQAEVLNGEPMTDSNKHLVIEWLRNEYSSPLTHKIIYRYEFTGGIAEIYADGKKYHRREQLAGKAKIGKWGECFFISIVESDGVLFIDTDSGQHLLTSTGQRSRR